MLAFQDWAVLPLLVSLVGRYLTIHPHLVALCSAVMLHYLPLPTNVSFLVHQFGFRQLLVARAVFAGRLPVPIVQSTITFDRRWSGGVRLQRYW